MTEVIFDRGKAVMDQLYFRPLVFWGQGPAHLGVDGGLVLAVIHFPAINESLMPDDFQDFAVGGLAATERKAAPGDRLKIRFHQPLPDQLGLREIIPYLFGR